MYNLESVFENEKHKILWDFDIQTEEDQTLEIEGRAETIYHLNYFIKIARILRKVLQTWVDLLSLWLQ